MGESMNCLKKSKLLPSCQSDKRFYVCDGTHYSNYYEFFNGLKTMEEKTFIYHANENKNDFASWVRNVFEDHRLAKEIAKLSTPRGMAKKVEGRIKVLQKNLYT